jgi:hypothetical protein
MEWLNNRGIILYLASGTDQDDVREEAEFLIPDFSFAGELAEVLGWEYK